jgi:hypothetical protein
MRASPSHLEATSQEKQLEQLIQAGFDLLTEGRTGELTIAACDLWLEAWELVKQMAAPKMGTAQAFDRAYPNLHQSVYFWSEQLDMELHNAGLVDPRYHEHRLHYVREYLTQFPDESDDSYVNLKRAEGEALWELGRQTEAETVYQALITKLPHKAWGHIGWADQYTWGHGRSIDYERAEDILLQAMYQPDLDEPVDVAKRLMDLYEARGWPKEIPESVIDLIEHLQSQEVLLKAEIALLEREQRQLQAEAAASKPKKLKRNQPCWCGSGKKYKQCHMKSDKR